MKSKIVNDKERLIKILNVLLGLDDIRVIKYTIEALIDDLNDEEDKVDGDK